MSIGVFDSGIGGITVLAEAMRVMPREKYIYYADRKNIPYGIKTKNEVSKFVNNAVAIMVEKDIKALLIACNTATSTSVAELRQKYNFPVIGMEPAVKPAVKKSNGRRVLVLATPLTLAETKFKKLVSEIDNDGIVDYQPVTELVTMAEKYEFSSEKVKAYIRSCLSEILLEDYSAIVLGCTHFIYYKKLIKNMVPAHIDIIDGNYGTVRHLRDTLVEIGYSFNKGNGNIRYIISGNEIKEQNEINKFNNILCYAMNGEENCLDILHHVNPN